MFESNTKYQLWTLICQTKWDGADKHPFSIFEFQWGVCIHKHDGYTRRNSIIFVFMISLYISKRFNWTRLRIKTIITSLTCPYIFTPFLHYRMIWLVLLCACTGLLLWQIVDRVVFFYTWPTTVNIKVNYNKTLRFPAVTICNQNAFK